MKKRVDPIDQITTEMAQTTDGPSEGSSK
jgi:hypothetical protein